jgi:predicted ATP-grasp superfamily ATP-dependent carboligase
MRNNPTREARLLVVSAGWSPGAYDILRSLGMAGVTGWVASAQPGDMAFHSRYCGGKLLLPPFSPENYPEILARLQTFGAGCPEKPVLFYASDPELWFVWRYRIQLEPFFRFLLPPDALLEKLFNKVLFSELAREKGLPVPATIAVRHPADLPGIIGEVRFPCIVKPAYSQDWIWDTEEQRSRFGPYKKALRRFASEAELLDFCSALPDRVSGFVVQEYIDGRDETIDSFHGYFDRHSQCRGFFLGRKIRTYPPHTGGSAYICTIHNTDLARNSIEYLQRIGFQGIVKIDYKWNERNQNFDVLEINPRYNLWELLGAYAGANLAVIAYRDQRDLDPEPRGEYRADARLIYLKQDFRGFWTGYRRTGEWSIGSYAGSLLRVMHFRIFDPNDPVPFVRSVCGFLKRNTLRLLGARTEGVRPGERAFIASRWIHRPGSGGRKMPEGTQRASLKETSPV